MKIRLSRKSNLEQKSDKKICFAIFMLMLLSNGMFARINIPASIRIIIILLIPFVFVTTQKKVFSLKRNAILLAVLLLGLQAITCLANGIYMEQDLFLIGSLFAALMFCGVISFERFVAGYREVIYWIALLSTIVYSVNVIFPNLINLIPSFMLQQGSSTGTYTLLWTIVVKKISVQTYNRNFGIFVEPGQFQLFLCIAFIIEFFYYRKIEWKRILVIALAVVTCRSTNGFLALIPIVIAYLLDESKFEEKSRKKSRFVFGCLIVVLGLVLFFSTSENIIAYIIEVVEKVESLSATYSYEDVGSGIERRRSMDVAWKMFVSSPVVGLGYKGWMIFKQNLTSSSFIMTFSPLNWFARFGVVYGVIVNSLYVSSFVFIPKKFISKLFVALSMFIMISAQEVTSDPFIWVLIFYGCENLFYRRKTNNLCIENSKE